MPARGLEPPTSEAQASLPGRTGWFPPPWQRLSHGKADGWGNCVEAAMGLVMIIVTVSGLVSMQVVRFFSLDLSRCLTRGSELNA